MAYESNRSIGKVDPVNATIRGVSVITSGLVARGHDLEVDNVTLVEMQAAAKAKRQVPVKVDHKSGAGAVCGYLSDFRIDGNKLQADWHLLKTHPQTEQILETAQRMPSGIGLSAAFVSPKNAPRGKTRVEELLSVDYVAAPAANPDGLFAATIDGRVVEFSAKKVIGKILNVATDAAVNIKDRLGGKAAHGIPPGDFTHSDPSVRAAAHLRRKGAERLHMRGAIVGGVTTAALTAGAGYLRKKFRGPDRPDRREVDDDQESRDRRLAEHLGDVAAVLAEEKRRRDDEVRRSRRSDFSARTATVHRVIDATADNIHLPEVSLPGQDVAEIALHKARQSALIRRLGIRAVKIGIGAAGGAYAGNRVFGRRGVKAGAVAGGVAGALFEAKTETNSDMNTDTLEAELGPVLEAVNKQIDQYTNPIREGQRETATLETLPQRIFASPEECRDLISQGILKPENEVAQGRTDGPMVFDSDHLNQVRRFVLNEVAANAVDGVNGDDDTIRLTASQALNEHCKQFSPGHVPRTTRLSRTAANVREFTYGRSEEDEQRPSALATLGKTAAVTAGVAGLGLYGAGTYAAHQKAMSLAATGGQRSADQYLRSVGVRDRLRMGWGLAKGATTGGAMGARAGLDEALRKIREAKMPST